MPLLWLLIMCFSVLMLLARGFSSCLIMDNVSRISLKSPTSISQTEFSCMDTLGLHQIFFSSLFFSFLAFLFLLSIVFLFFTLVFLSFFQYLPFYSSISYCLDSLQATRKVFQTLKNLQVLHHKFGLKRISKDKS